MERLQSVTLIADDEGVLSRCVAQWEIVGVVNGYKAVVSVSGDVSLKPVTDEAQALLDAVRAEGPPPPQ